VAAVVTCHNYGRYLGQCLKSLLTQTVPFAEIVVVDDASEDNTARVADSFRERGVSYLRVEARNVNVARTAGLSATTAPLLVFIDPDNWFRSNFLARLLPHSTDPYLGVIHAPPVLVDEDGRNPRPSPFEGRPFDHYALRRGNYVDCCSLVRRDAVTQVGGWCSESQQLADWSLWLRMTRDGWRGLTIPGGSWYYRIHGQQMSKRTAAELAQEEQKVLRECCHLLVLTPFCGRTWALDRYCGTLARLGWDKTRLHGMFLDNSCDPAFGCAMRERLLHACGDWASVQFIYDPTPVQAGIPNTRFGSDGQLRVDTVDALTDTIARVYARRAQPLMGMGVDFVLTIEDDIQPLGVDIVPRLLRGFDAGNVMAVTGVVRSRFDMKPNAPNQILTWRVLHERPYLHERLDNAPRGIVDVGGSGMGCLLMRAEAWAKYVPRRLSVNDDKMCYWHDVAIAKDLRMAGLRWRMTDAVRCRHWQENGTWV